MYLILSSQTSVMNNFQNVINRRADIQEDVKCYQDTLSYASSKVDYSVVENIYMLPSDMNLNIGWELWGTTTKIFVSDGKFSLGKNDKVNTLGSAKIIIRSYCNHHSRRCRTDPRRGKSCLDTHSG